MGFDGEERREVPAVGPQADGLSDQGIGCRLPLPVELVTFIGLRMTLRRKNLFDRSGVTVQWGPTPPPPR